MLNIPSRPARRSLSLGKVGRDALIIGRRFQLSAPAYYQSASPRRRRFYSLLILLTNLNGVRYSLSALLKPAIHYGACREVARHVEGNRESNRFVVAFEAKLSGEL
jgi:hypothetical protein